MRSYECKVYKINSRKSSNKRHFDRLGMTECPETPVTNDICEKVNNMTFNILVMADILKI